MEPVSSLRWLVATVLAVVMLRALAALDPESALWGINFTGFLGPVFIAVCTGIGIILALPKTVMALDAPLRQVSAALFPDDRVRRRIVHMVTAAVMTLVFWKAFIPFSFLGDGAHVVRALFRFNQGAGLAYGTLWNEPLTVLLYNTVAQLFATVEAGSTGVELVGYTRVFIALAVFSGTAAVFGVLTLVSRVVDDGLERLALSIGVLSAAGVLFFFGYVEYYAPMYACGVLFLLSGLDELRRGRRPWRSTAIVVLGIAFHLSVLVFLPAAITLWILSRRGGSLETESGTPDGWMPLTASMLRRAALIHAAVLTVLFGVYLWLTFGLGSGFFIAPVQGEGTLSLLAPQHLLDVLNNLLIGAPLAVALLLWAVFALGARKVWTAAGVFTGTAVLYWLALVIAHSGIARDWDVYALLGASTTVLAFTAIRSISVPGRRRYALVQFALQSPLLVLPWIAVNVDFESALRRYIAITETYADLLPPRVTAGHYETLRAAFVAGNDREAEIGIISRVIALTNDPYEYYKLTRAVENTTAMSQPVMNAIESALNGILVMPDSVRATGVGRDEQSRMMQLDDVYVNLVRATGRLLPEGRRAAWAEAAGGPMIERGREVFDISVYAGNRCFDEAMFDRAVFWYRRALSDAEAQSADGATLAAINNQLAVSLVKTGQREEALKTFATATAYPEATAVMWSNYGFALYQYAEFSAAARPFGEALRRDSTDLNALYCLGKIHLIDPARHATGRRLLEAFLSREQGTPRAEDARESLSMRLPGIGTP